MKKRFTLTILGLLLMVGGVMAQAVSLQTSGGQNVNCQQKDGYTEVKFNHNSFNGKWNGYYGSDWVTSYTSGTKHRFIFTFKSGVPSGLDLHFVVTTVEDWNNDESKKLVDVIIADGATSFQYDIEEGYGHIQITNTGENNSNLVLEVVSITREVIAASSVAVPTISPASGTYDGDLSVTITPGEGNDKVIYSISGATTGNVTGAEINAAATVNLTGTGTITVTATGYKNNEASSEVTATYTYGIPNGKSSISEGLPHTFNTWNGDNSLVIANSNFSNMETGDYVVLGVEDVQANGTVLGFRANWEESPYSGCTSVSSGNGAKGVFNRGDTQWWLKASNNDVVNAFKNSTVRMQGGMIPKEVAGTPNDATSSITLNSIAVYKSFAISETENNSITKYNNVVVELTRTFAANTWNTICLPFKPTADQATEMFGEGYKIAKFTSVSGETMQFTKLSSIDAFVAGTPYLVWVTQNEKSSFTFFNVNITARQPQPVGQGDYQFVGLFEKKSFQESEWPTTRFVAAGNKLKTPNSTSALKALRAYFVVPAGSSSAPMLSIDGEGEATSIEDLENSRTEELNIYYDLSGRRVENPTKGIYIMNGKKVILK